MEWFYSYIDERRKIFAPLFAGSLLLRWEESLREAGEERVRIVRRVVSEGVGVPGRYREQLRLMQDMVYAWGENPRRGDAQRVNAAIVNTERSLLALTESDAEAIIEAAGLNVSVWRAKRERPETRARGALANARYREAMRQAIAQNPRYANTPQDPILLIDGKYLLTGYVTGRTKNLFRMANRIIRERLDEMPRLSLEEDEIGWGQKTRPRRGELTELSEPGEASVPGTIEVEWLYSYVTDEGRPVNVRWFENVLKKWHTSAKQAGIYNIEVRTTPVGATDPDGRWNRHLDLHQSLILAWDEEGIESRKKAHWALNGTLAEAPGAMGTIEDIREVLPRFRLDPAKWEERRARPETLERMAKANERAGGGFSAEGSTTFVINGKYRVSTEGKDAATRAFQILNWAIEELRNKG